MVDYYQILGVKSTASEKEINAAYKRLARIRHPDLNSGSAEAAREFIEIAKARELLIDPKRRAAYDAQRNAYATRGAYAPIVNPTVKTHVSRARSDARIRENLDNFLAMERAEARALQQAVYPIVALLLSAFFIPLVRPHFWRDSGWAGRSVILVLCAIGIWHTVSKIRIAIKLHTKAYLYVGVGAVVCALLGTLIGISLSDSLLSAMPMFFDRTIRLELLLYPWIVVWMIDLVHSFAQRIDI